MDGGGGVFVHYLTGFLCITFNIHYLLVDICYHGWMPA